MNLILLTALTGCAPQDATVTGQWYSWLAANSSATVEEGDLDMTEATAFECSGRKWDPETCDFEEGYIGAIEGPTNKNIGGQCRMTNVNGNFKRDDGPCDVSYTDDCNEEDVALYDEQCTELTDLKNNRWIIDDGYYGLSGAIEPWRSEALINSEGDLQLTVHVDLGNRQDFRFGFSIDPDFAPVDCLEDEEGEAYVTHRDGSDWVDEWSEDEDGHRIYYLNSGSYQHNPYKGEDTWYLSNDMISGFGFSKFAAEELTSRAVDYGDYTQAYEAGTDPVQGDNFLAVDDHEFPDLSDYDERFKDLCEKTVGAECPHLIEEGVDTTDLPMSWAEEFVEVLGANKDGEAQFEHKVESNKWRPIDSTISGLDGWMEVHSSWVRLQTGQTVADGERVKGDFQILFEGDEGGSRVLVRGEFDIEALREDRWGYQILEDAKREEKGTEFCGGATLE